MAELENIVTEVEKLCGLGLSSEDGVPISTMSVDAILDYCMKQESSLPKESVKALNESVGRKMVLLSYLNSRMRYFEKQKIDFSEIPCMRIVSRSLLAFTSSKTVDNAALATLDKCVIVLDDVANKYPKVTKTLAYRYLRIYLVLIAYGFLFHAGIVADLILNQIIIA